MMNNNDNRCVELGEYIIETKATVRQAAEVFGISKSTVHIDVTKRLSKVSPNLAKQVNEVLQENKAQRHIRGGEATKEKYLHLKGIDI
ncbi:MAG: sporulation transcriptional regulator SpoIIID [Eubacterium sp.]